MLRALLTTAISGALTVALITAAPPTASAATNDHQVIATRGSGLGELPVTLPPTRKRSLEGTALAVGETLSVTWDQQQLDAEEQLYASRLDVLGATEGQAYQLTLHGSGPISAFVVDADGEIVTYASHPFAQSAAPTLEWEFAPGDVIVLVSDDLPLDSRTATVRLTAYVGDGSLPSTRAGSLPASGVSGAVRPTSPAVPFHGGHFDARWALNAGAGSQNNVVLSFEGDEEDTDWLSVLVLDDQLDADRRDPGGVGRWPRSRWPRTRPSSLPRTCPDEFGSYSFQWLTGSESEITDIIGPSWWTLSSQPGYRVEFDRSGSVEASSGWLGERGPSHSVEISRDGEAWAPGKVERPDVDIDEGGVRILLLDGQWQLRLVTELGGVEFVAEPIAFRAAGDDLGWRVTSLRLSTPKEQYTPGRGSWYRDLRNSVVATETYRDGTTRTRRITPDRVQFKYAGKPGWLGLTEGGSDPRGTVRVPANGTLRVADKSGKVLSNEIAVSVPKGTKSLSRLGCQAHEVADRRWCDGAQGAHRAAVPRWDVAAG